MSETPDPALLQAELHDLRSQLAAAAHDQVVVQRALVSQDALVKSLRQRLALATDVIADAYHGGAYSCCCGRTPCEGTCTYTRLKTFLHG